MTESSKAFLIAHCRRDIVSKLAYLYGLRLKWSKGLEVCAAVILSQGNQFTRILEEPIHSCGIEMFSRVPSFFARDL